MSDYKYRYHKQKKHKKVQDNYVPDFPEEKLNLPLEEINLHPKTLEALKTVGLSTVNDLAVRSEKDLFKLKGFNKKSYLDILKKLEVIGVSIKPLADGEPSILDAQAQTQSSKEQKVTVSGKKNDANEAKRFLNNSLQNENAEKSSSNPKSVASNNGRVSLQRQDRERKEAKSHTKETREERRPQKPTPIKEEEKEEKETLKKYLINGKYGFKDQNNKVVIHADYDELYPFKEGLACFQTGDYFGYIDMENNVVIPADTYVLASSFSEGLAAVMPRDKYGYIDKNNEFVIKPQFDAATPFIDGEARIKIGDKWGALFKDGSIRMFK